MVRIVKPLTLSIAEFVIGGFVLLITFYQKRDIIVDISNNKAGYFIVFYSENGLTENNMDRKFLFDREVTPEGNYIFISPKVKEKYHVDFEFPSSWWERPGGGVGSHLGTLTNNVGYEFFRIIPLSEAQQDSVISKEINSAANKVYE